MDTIGPYALDSIITGDARELAKAIPDESVDLIFTDPVYWQIEDYAWLAETAARVLKPDRAMMTFYGIGYLPETCAAMSALQYRWNVILAMPYRNGGHIPGGFSQYIGCLWHEKGKSKTKRQVPDMRLWRPNDGPFEWAKNPDFVGYYLEALTADNAIVFDPFTGLGTVPAVCKMLRRHYLAFEINPDTAERARQRVLTTQAPLVFPEPAQLTMEV